MDCDAEPIGMTMISEDPSYIVGALLLIGVGFLLALRLSGRGKHLIFGLAAFAAAGIFVAVDYFWVTDNERVEAVLERVRVAVLHSDAEAVFAELTPDARLGSFGPADTRAIIANELPRIHFDFVRFSQKKTSAGGQSRRGTVEFRAVAAGMANAEYAPSRIAIDGSDWSFGVEETAPGVWKINRITPVRLPGPISLPALTNVRPPDNRDRGQAPRRRFETFFAPKGQRLPRKAAPSQDAGESKSNPAASSEEPSARPARGGRRD